MKYNTHSNLRGKHAFLSPSQYHWTNYTEEKLVKRFHTYRAAERGTQLHELAEKLIDLGIKMPANDTAFSQFVNDAIGYGMIPELILYYSDNSFGTADAVLFKDGLLRIHDLKTGVSKASIRQLEVYTALFCLEYEVDPETIEIELRIYQGSEVMIYEPNVELLIGIMETIVEFDDIVDELKAKLGVTI